jgi:hypothetical protein
MDNRSKSGKIPSKGILTYLLFPHQILYVRNAPQKNLQYISFSSMMKNDTPINQKNNGSRLCEMLGMLVSQLNFLVIVFLLYF